MSSPKPTIEDILKSSIRSKPQRDRVRQRYEKSLRDHSKPKCVVCSYHCCVFCSRLMTEHGHKMSPHHCEKHCRHKSKRHVLSVVKVLDLRSEKGMGIK